MNEWRGRLYGFFDRRLFVCFVIYLAIVAVMGEMASVFRARHLFARCDWAIAQYVFSWRSDFMTVVMKSITFIGAAGVAIFLTLAAAAFLTRLKKYAYSVALLVAVGVSYLSSFLIKIIFERPRPQAYRLIPEDGFSFPSGHAAAAIALFGFITYILIRDLEKRYQRVIVFLAGCFIILAVGVSRVYLGVHWPSDVLGSYAFGGLWLLFVIYLTERQMKISPP